MNGYRFWTTRPKNRPYGARWLVGTGWCAVVLWLAAGATAGAGDQLLAPHHVAQLRSVTSAEISPDGRWVAYTLSVPRDLRTQEDGPAWSELHVVDTAGRSRPFVTGQVNVGEVQWMPDGRAIAFVAKRSGDAESTLYRIPVDGGEARSMLTHATGLHQVAFTRDGNRVAFLATEPLPKQQQLFQDQGFRQEIYEEDWRPTRVWIGPADGSAAAQPLDLPGSAHDVCWRPDGRQLAVVLAPTPSVDDSYMFKRISIVDADTHKVIQKVSNPGKLGQIAWSPDGRHLALISGADIHDPSAGRLLVVDMPGAAPLRDLMPDFQAHVSGFRWRDDQTLLWVAGQGTGTVVGEVTLTGPRQVRIEAGELILSNVSLTGDGSAAALLGQTPQYPAEVFSWRTDQPAPKRLTTSNVWLDRLRLARQEVVRWRARDGLDLEGVLVYPVNYEAGRRYPLILCVHGGPEAHVSNGWVTSYSRPGQTGAARGFAVFYPNYRGSTGRGVAFSKLGQADAAGKEFDDLIDAIDHLVNIGLVDRARVGITGGSYGGYASAWGATYYSDRFAASVMFVGISDNMSKIGTTDIPEEMYLVHHRKRLWEDWDYFLDHSPIRYVERNRTPTLILHGKSDPRVHPSQSLELFRHLKTLNQAPVRLVLYPGEGHGNRRAAARLDYSLRLLRWMEYYLQGPGGAAPDWALDYSSQLGPVE